MPRLREIAKRNPLLLMAFVLAVVATLFFAARAVTFAVSLHWRSEQPVASWMTPRYIVRTYGLERAALDEVLGTTDRDDLRQPLYTIARERGMTTAELIAAVQDAIDAQDGDE
ncbi:hypothetical protein GU927_011975 [Rhodobacteraceae bacterium HSP-20]|uniref:Uncharacterized protein n=1 Tax=Paragemmobacter amnigenus TaxID=2852097 RepID=A0ABS6J485_9RHOB|nr:hypothetical protein [Rhodobacter amnigenus]MBU9698561.1 hypothetical protein [Rhodobacter amnigenus]MBV4389788.1 hypothetical protein [Rhodobacter amnigenus]